MSEFDETPAAGPAAGPTVWRTELWETVRTIAIAVVAALLIRNFVIRTYTVEGPSMEPTFVTGDRVAVLEAAYWFGPPRPGQVVVFVPPVSSADDYIKRVVAVGPATVEIRDGAVYVNGVLQPDDYVYPPDADDKSQGPITVPAGDVFVMGDHRNDSRDSRSFGAVSEKAIAGRVLFVWWPPRAAGGIPTASPRTAL